MLVRNMDNKYHDLLYRKIYSARDVDLKILCVNSIFYFMHFTSCFIFQSLFSCLYYYLFICLCNLDMDNLTLVRFGTWELAQLPVSDFFFFFLRNNFM